MKASDNTQYLIKLQQLRIMVENLIVPLLLIVFSLSITVIALITTQMYILLITDVFCLLMQALVIVYSKFWRGRSG